MLFNTNMDYLKFENYCFLSQYMSVVEMTRKKTILGI